MVPSHGIPSQPEAPRLREQVREAIRVRHYSLRTEQTYVSWIKRFILFHGNGIHAGHGRAGGPAVPVASGRSRSCRRLHTKSGVKRGLVSGPAGPQARHWLVDDVVRAKQSQRVPVVLTQDEGKAVLARTSRVPPG